MVDVYGCSQWYLCVYLHVSVLSHVDTRSSLVLVCRLRAKVCFTVCICMLFVVQPLFLFEVLLAKNITGNRQLWTCLLM